MRIALISDIHGNAVALETVLEDLKTEHIDHIACLGDVASGGPQPRRVIAHLQTHKCLTVLGNMDTWCLAPQPTRGTSKNAQRGDAVRYWVVDQLTSDDLNFLGTFQATLNIPLADDTHLLCYHGCPESNEQGISSRTTEENLVRRLSDYQALVFAGGHSHRQMIRRYGESLLLNPGSVGAPSVLRNQSRSSAWAEYGIVDWNQGHLHTELRRIPIDTHRMAKAVHESGMPHPNWWLQSKYGQAVQ